MQVDFKAITRDFFSWYATLLRHFLFTVPWVLLCVVTAYGVARATTLLSFFVPLKIIFLAAAPEIPQFIPFINADNKAYWIAALAVLAFGLFLLTLWLDSEAERLSKQVGKRLMAHAEKLVVTGEMESSAGNFFYLAGRIVSNLIFFALSAVVLYVVSGMLVVFVVLSIVLVYMVTASLLSGDPLKQSRLRLFVVERLNVYLQSLSAVIFFAGFVALLLPFLGGEGGNVLLVILAIALLRQALASLATVVSDAVGLQRGRARVDGLFRREVQLHNPVQAAHQLIRHALRPEARMAFGLRALNEAGLEPDPENVRVQWVDSDVQNVKKLAVRIADENGAGRLFLLRLFFRPSHSQYQNESILFQHADRSAVNAPESFACFTEASFICVLTGYGAGVAPTLQQWRACKHDYLKRVWSHAVPESLVEAYASTHPLLHQRLTRSLVERIFMGVDTTDQEMLVHRLLDNLPALQDRLAALPMYVYNPILRPATTVLNEDEHILATDWWGWSVEPLGGGRNNRAEIEVLVEFLPELKKVRAGMPPELSANDVRIACQCQLLEDQLNGEGFNAALETAERIMRLIES